MPERLRLLFDIDLIMALKLCCGESNDCNMDLPFR